VTSSATAESVELASLTWAEYARRVEESAVVFVPCAATEQHGPHLPLGTDAVIAVEVARAAAKRVNGLVAPPLAYGFRSQPQTGGGEAFPGTTSIRGETLMHLVRDVIEALVADGAHRIVVLNSHYENTHFLIEGIELALTSETGSDAKVLFCKPSAFLQPATVDAIFEGRSPDYAFEHAGVMETSLMLALAEESVGERRDAPVFDAARPYDVYPQPGAKPEHAGSLSSPKGARAELGRKIFEDAVDGLVAAVERELIGESGSSDRT
jgi:creatinine amidohydrolase